MKRFAASLLGLPRRVPGVDPKGGGGGEDPMRDLRIYLWGYGLALPLTGAAFALVAWPVLPAGWLPAALGLLGLAQVVVHFRCFLHIGGSRQSIDDLYLILFSTLILAAMAGGTIWVLGDLAARMH